MIPGIRHRALEVHYYHYLQNTVKHVRVLDLLAQPDVTPVVMKKKTKKNKLGPVDVIN